MSLKKYIFSENLEEIEKLIKLKFKKELKTTFGHSNFPFTIKNININKFKRLFVNIIIDERRIKESREINYSGIKESRGLNETQIDIFSYKRDNRDIGNVGKLVEYRVDNTNMTTSCSTCNGNKQITCGSCSGSGKNRCDTCNGQRQVRCTVWGCNGGKVKCLWCSGKGVKKEGYGANERTVRCSCNNGYNNCSSCNNGFNTCSTCNGNGEVSCFTCSSSGKVDCYSCDSQGSFTNYFSVESVLIEKKNYLVVSGNNPGEFINKKQINEEFIFSNDLNSYNILKLKDYKLELRELLNEFIPNERQEGCNVYASLEDCASLTYEISVGESVYLGKLKNEELWFDNSVMNLLFYDLIDSLVVEKNFKKILSNRAAFEGNLGEMKNIWDSIKEYHKFENIIESKDNVTEKINNLRELKLLDNDDFLNYLYQKFTRKEIIIKTIFTVFVSVIVILTFKFTYFDNLLINILTHLLITGFFLLLTFLITKSLIKSWKPLSVSIIGFVFVLFGHWVNFTTITNFGNNNELNSSNNKDYKKQPNIYNNKNIKNSEVFKKNQIRGLLQEENNQNFNEIVKYYEVKGLVKYFNYNQLTLDKLKSIYQTSWSNTIKPLKNINTIKKIEDNVYDVDLDFSFTNKHDNIYQILKRNIRFVLNENGKIIKVYELADASVDEKKGVIIIDKAYFYDSPFSGNGSGAYLIKGDNFTYTNSVDNFIKVIYKNPKGIITTGWIVKSAIKEIESPISDDLDKNEILQKIKSLGKSSFTVKVKDDVLNLNIRKLPISGSIINKVSGGEIYNVTKVLKMNKPLYLLKRKTVLKDIVTREEIIKPAGFNLSELKKVRNNIYRAVIINEDNSVNRITLSRNDFEIENNDWYFLKELNGWVYSKFVNKIIKKEKKNSEFNGDFKYIAKFNNFFGSIPLREGNNVNTKKIYDCPKDAVVYVIDDSDNYYYKVNINGVYTGYINSQWLVGYVPKKTEKLAPKSKKNKTSNLIPLYSSNKRSVGKFSRVLKKSQKRIIKSQKIDLKEIIVYNSLKTDNKKKYIIAYIFNSLNDLKSFKTKSLSSSELFAEKVSEKTLYYIGEIPQ